MEMMTNLPSRMSMLPDIHLSKAAHVSNTDNVDREVAEEVNDLLD